jgi:protein-disulfide isomerase
MTVPAERRPWRFARSAAAGLLGMLALAGCGSDVSHIATAATHSSATTATTATSTATTGAPAPGTAAEPLSAAAGQVAAQLRGIPERGLVLGRSGAPVTIIEYGDLVCGLCTAVHDSVLPTVIARYVRSGRATLELRPLAAGAVSNALARAAYAAGVQGRGWDFVQLSYRRSGLVGKAAEPRQALARALGLDLVRWRADLGRASWKVDIDGAQEVAKVAGFGAYPVFLVTRTVRDITKAPAPYIVLTVPSSVGAFDRAIAKALARHG